ncbi:MAG TPA: BamA/TamA family outer membrane protein [Steroidobacteraceae bacterium]|nr:BamA/TamA family outer membrane protein [Steroidobacteraceae bacterium]
MATGAAGVLWLLSGTPGVAQQQVPEAPAAPPAGVTPTPPPPGGVMRWLDPATAPFIPIPEIDVDPHSGVTVGVIAGFLDLNEHGEIERITAPDIFHSQYFGWGVGSSVYGFPSDEDQWVVLGSVKQHIEYALDARYLAGETRAKPLSWSVETVFDRIGTARFFGLGNETPDYDESTYVDEQAALAASVGYNFTAATQLAYGARWRRVEVLPGVLTGIPSTPTLYPDLNGLGTEHALEQTLTLTHDTRDSITIPHSGARYLVYAGFASRSLASSVAYSFLGAEARCYFPLGQQVTLALHAAARYMPSAGEAPFWALSSLGGDRSITNGREALRSDGADRFVDENLVATGAELRARVAGLDAFGTRVSIELAPFIDAGKVFSNGPGSVLSDMHTAAGVGFRGVASPYVVGYVDVGYGRGKTAVFSGINYPF